MNKSTLRVLAVCSLIAVLGPASVMAQSLHVNVPFGFSAGPKSFAAGEYVVNEVSPQVLVIQSADYHTHVMVVTHSGATGSPGRAVLRFQRYGDQYFLSAVSTPYRAWGLPVSAREKELIAKWAPQKQLEVLARK
ncbi:MAG TPA: hypothetical protein VG297_02885 [Bryobacteraceae bacterium]|jgi:hypothetical protein|nr:hypothetical protein [Bryobacteraceae bacterium]